VTGERLDLSCDSPADLLTVLEMLHSDAG